MRVYQDFYVYEAGVYRHSKLTEQYLSGYHSVRIIGWGEEQISNGIPEKYWVRKSRKQKTLNYFSLDRINISLNKMAWISVFKTFLNTCLCFSSWRIRGARIGVKMASSESKKERTNAKSRLTFLPRGQKRFNQS